MRWPSKDPDDYRRGQPAAQPWPSEPAPARRPWAFRWQSPYWLGLSIVGGAMAVGAAVAAAGGQDPVDGAFPFGWLAGYLLAWIAEAYYRRRST